MNDGDYWFVAGDGRMEVEGETAGAGDAAGFVPVAGEGSALAEGEAVGLGVGVGQGFSREVHWCQSAVSTPPRSFQSSRHRAAQCA